MTDSPKGWSWYGAIHAEPSSADLERKRKTEHAAWRIKSGIAVGRLYTDDEAASLHRAHAQSK